MTYMGNVTAFLEIWAAYQVPPPDGGVWASYLCMYDYLYN